MGFLDMFRRTPEVKAEMGRPAPGWMLMDAEHSRFSIPDGSLAGNQADLYRRLSWVQSAVSGVAQAAAVVPFSVKRRVGESTRDIPNHPFELLLQRPNPLQSRFEFLESIFSYFRLTGNAYVWLNRASPDAAPVEMWIIPSNKITPIPDGQLYLRGYMYDDGSGTPYALEPHEVVHFKRFHPLNAFVGLSPIEALATVAVGDLKMQEWNTNFFGKDNAKMPGFLAFADVINESDWKRLKEETRESNGGVRRSLMMLRGVGKGGVEWVSTAMSQKDMEFLSARTFNKEEIFSVLAPGLASILDVSATEANASAGKATFVEFSIWPTLVAVAEKLTTDVLPMFGRNLVGMFDDIRPRNRELELKEIELYSRFHTVDEVRERFYQSAPISKSATKAAGDRVWVAAGPSPCERCRALDGLPESEWPVDVRRQGGPPLHPGCQCGTV